MEEAPIRVLHFHLKAKESEKTNFKQESTESMEYDILGILDYYVLGGKVMKQRGTYSFRRPEGKFGEPRRRSRGMHSSDH